MVTPATLLRAVLPCVLAASLLLGSAVVASAATPADRTFVAKALQRGTFEVAAARVAVQKAASPVVRDVARTEQRDRAAAGARLRSLAAGAGFTFGTKLHPRYRTHLARLAALSGQTFDRAFVRAVRDLHAEDAAAFAREAQRGGDRSLRTYAAAMAVTIERQSVALRSLHVRPPASELRANR